MKQVKIKMVHHLNSDFAKGDTVITSEEHGNVLKVQGFAEIIGDATPEDVAALLKAKEAKVKKPAK